METNETDKLITGFLRGKLNSEEEIKLLTWVKQSRKNKDLFLKRQALSEEELIRKKDPASNESWKRLKVKIASLSIQKSEIRLQDRQFRKILAIAAAFVMGVIISSVVITFLPGGKNMQALQYVTTPYGARTQFQLPDGSTVWLNSGSKLSYPSHFAKNRKVSLEGEAFFKVQKGRPFIVSTKYANVRVKGTSFNVKAFQNEDFETTLVSGSVQVKRNETGEEITLQPGFQVKQGKGKWASAKVETELFTSWKEGKLIFRNEYLPEVAKSLERWYNVTIELDNDPRLAKIYFSGIIEMESFPEVLELLKTTSPIDYTFDKKSRTLHIIRK